MICLLKLINLFISLFVFLIWSLTLCSSLPEWHFQNVIIVTKYKVNFVH